MRIAAARMVTTVPGANGMRRTVVHCRDDDGISLLAAVGDTVAFLLSCAPKPSKYRQDALSERDVLLRVGTREDRQFPSQSMSTSRPRGVRSLRKINVPFRTVGHRAA